MQRVARRDPLLSLQIHPALAAHLRRARVPADPQRLVSAAWEGHQILLHRLDAEGEGDFEVFDRPGRTFRADSECRAPSREAAGDALVDQLGVVEIAEHGRVVGVLHGEIVMRPAPGVMLRLMAAGTGLRPDMAVGVDRLLRKCGARTGRRLRQQRGRRDDQETDRDKGGEQSPQARVRTAGHLTHRRDCQGTAPNDRAFGTDQP